MMQSLSHQRIVGPQPLAASLAPNRRAFTLIELMVVIAIIVLLVALTVSVVVILNQKSEARRTERALELITMALNEWETAAERTITYGTNGQPAPQGGGPAPVYMIQEPTTPGNLDALHEFTHAVIEIISKNAQAKSILGSIDPKLLRHHATGDPSRELELSLFDPWDNDVVVIFPGRKFGPTDLGDPDPDGTIRTDFENIFGVCANGKICFLSYGPDGDPGNLHLQTAQASLTADQLKDIEKAADNLSSYPLLKPRAP